VQPITTLSDLRSEQTARNAADHGAGIRPWPGRLDLRCGTAVAV